MFRHSRQRKAVMARLRGRSKPTGQPMYGTVQSPDDISKINDMIRADVGKAKTEAELDVLRQRSQYLYTLTSSPAWRNIPNLRDVRQTAASEYSKTAQVINTRAEQIGIKKHYDEVIGEGKVAKEK